MRVRGRNGRDCAHASVATVRLLVVPDMVCADVAVAASRPSAPAAAKMIVRVILAPLVLRYARPLRTSRQLPAFARSRASAGKARRSAKREDGLDHLSVVAIRGA